MYNTINIADNYNNTTFGMNNTGRFKNRLKKIFPESKYYSYIEKNVRELAKENNAYYAIQSFIEQQHLSTNILYRTKERIKHSIHKAASKVFGI